MVDEIETAVLSAPNLPDNKVGRFRVFESHVPRDHTRIEALGQSVPVLHPVTLEKPAASRHRALLELTCDSIATHDLLHFIHLSGGKALGKEQLTFFLARVGEADAGLAPATFLEAHRQHQVVISQFLREDHA